MLELVEDHALARVFRLHSRVLDGDHAERFRERCRDLPKQLPVVLDVAEVTFADSSGIGCILSLHRWMEDAGVTLSLAGARPDVLSLFELVQLHRVVDIYNDVPEALRSIRSTAARSTPAVMEVT
jgi:anti-sigma B factor antagonist